MAESVCWCRSIVQPDGILSVCSFPPVVFSQRRVQDCNALFLSQRRRAATLHQLHRQEPTLPSTNSHLQNECLFPYGSRIFTSQLLNFLNVCSSHSILWMLTDLCSGCRCFSPWKLQAKSKQSKFDLQYFNQIQFYS